ncbi:hypothetical protein LTR10_016767 [Elasticomyces elasticus]|nr:hypothetical protein LTR10_016767 [Elasticomyces elasticus]
MSKHRRREDRECDDKNPCYERRCAFLFPADWLVDKDHKAFEWDKSEFLSDYVMRLESEERKRTIALLRKDQEALGRVQESPHPRHGDQQKRKSGQGSGEEDADYVD